MRILIADGQSKVRFALRLLLGRRAEDEVVGEVAHAGELLPQIEATHPDLLLLDWELSGLSPDDSMNALREALPNLGVVVLSGRPETCQAALTAGADAFVSKTDPPERLLAAINGCGRRLGNGGEP